MRYIAAYLLAVLGGHPTPTENDVEKILKSSDVKVDKARVAAVIKAMEGKTAEEVIAAGSEKLAKFGSAGAAPAAAGGAAAGAEADKVEEKAVEEEEEVDMGGGMDMFGGDEDY
ncbi:60s Acidic ribosomal protein [Phytophthora infestans]|uniref:60s Acidic ribosomal protein n=1 Tax=Phytophthora infestans TaxID=4787 RepID=A0A833T9K1_PHYIN|nr:60s Acidic ribosomal protein [Phytophthora infestans]KAF4130310.1 60s Acidic ribosomal protein [Phytophthora infestans]KAF4147736.1 60s Acidic ribosomal protein [Phytophthora infestans]